MLLESFKTTNYDDFSRTVRKLFGDDGFSTFFGTTAHPPQGQVLVFATDKRVVVRLQMRDPLPDSFSNEFSRVVFLEHLDDFYRDGQFRTTNYGDFRRTVEELFGGGYKTFFGNRRIPHSDEVLVFATDNRVLVRLEMTVPLPESFSNEFSRATKLNDPEEFYPG